MKFWHRFPNFYLIGSLSVLGLVAFGNPGLAIADSFLGTLGCGSTTSHATMVMINGNVIHLGILIDTEKPDDSPRKKNTNRIQKRIDFARGGSFRHSVFQPIVSHVGQMTHLEKTP